MKVSELIEQLKFLDPDKEVAFLYPAGHYWHTIIAQKVTEVDEASVSFSEYHEKFTLDPDETEGCEYVVTLG
jgi:hypothetical protein